LSFGIELAVDMSPPRQHGSKPDSRRHGSLFFCNTRDATGFSRGWLRNYNPCTATGMAPDRMPC